MREKKLKKPYIEKKTLVFVRKIRVIGLCVCVQANVNLVLSEKVWKWGRYKGIPGQKIKSTFKRFFDEWHIYSDTRLHSFIHRNGKQHFQRLIMVCKFMRCYFPIQYNIIEARVCHQWQVLVYYSLDANVASVVFFVCFVYVELVGNSEREWAAFFTIWTLNIHIYWLCTDASCTTIDVAFTGAAAVAGAGAGAAAVRW